MKPKFIKHYMPEYLMNYNIDLYCDLYQEVWELSGSDLCAAVEEYL